MTTLFQLLNSRLHWHCGETVAYLAKSLTARHYQCVWPRISHWSGYHEAEATIWNIISIHYFFLSRIIKKLLAYYLVNSLGHLYITYANIIVIGGGPKIEPCATPPEVTGCQCTNRCGVGQLQIWHSVMRLWTWKVKLGEKKSSS